MNEWIPVVGASMTVAGTIGVAAATLRHNRQRDRRAEQRELDREAAEALRVSLNHLRELVQQSWDMQANTVHPRRVSEALAGWKNTYHQYKTRLPDRARHANRDVAAALGEIYGLVGASNVLPDSADYPVAEYDDTWAANAIGYLGHFIDWLDQWHYDPDGGAKRPLLGFDAWLQAEDKHLQAVANGTAFDTRIERVLFRLFGAKDARAR